MYFTSMKGGGYKYIYPKSYSEQITCPHRKDNNIKMVLN